MKEICASCGKGFKPIKGSIGICAKCFHDIFEAELVKHLVNVVMKAPDRKLDRGISG